MLKQLGSEKERQGRSGYLRDGQQGRRAAAACAVAVFGQRQFRQGRTGAGNGYGAPPSGGQATYEGAPSSSSQSQSAPSGGDDHQGLDWLLKSVPGQPGTDYPIFAEAPETSFLCDGQVEGGKY